MNANPFQALEEQGIAPVISLKDAEKAVPLARALLAGGLSSIEITLRTPAALDAIRAIHAEVPEMTVSAGTVLTKQQVEEATAAGADYVVMPGYSEEIVAYCQERGVAVIPGCVTASEVDRAIRAGLRILKYFPAESLGGLKAIDLLCGPYKGIRFLPTGGMNLENIGAYLASRNILACGGSFMAPAALVEREEWDEITARCRRAMDLSLGFSLAHVGLNSGNAEEAERVCRHFCLLFRLPFKSEDSVACAGTAVECRKSTGWGSRGYIGFRTSSCERAWAYFESIGVAVREESVRLEESGRVKDFFLNEEIGGFAVHVMK